MIPLRDNLPTRHAPLVTLLFIGINAYAFLKLFWLGSYAGQRYLLYYGLIPCSLTGSCQVTGRAFTPEVTLLTSMFVHAGFFHFAGNMLYLWIFGNNIEDSMGRIRFILFYFLCGVIAAATHALANAGSTVPMIGASGAISGILGAYLMLFPRARVLTLVILGFYIRTIEVPAMVVLGFWFVLQFLNALISAGTGAGVAWYAHVGGFIAGITLIGVFKRGDVPFGGRKSDSSL